MMRRGIGSPAVGTVADIATATFDTAALSVGMYTADHGDGSRLRPGRHRRRTPSFRAVDPREHEADRSASKVLDGERSRGNLRLHVSAGWGPASALYDERSRDGRCAVPHGTRSAARPRRHCAERTSESVPRHASARGRREYGDGADLAHRRYDRRRCTHGSPSRTRSRASPSHSIRCPCGSRSPPACHHQRDSCDERRLTSRVDAGRKRSWLSARRSLELLEGWSLSPSMRTALRRARPAAVEATASGFAAGGFRGSASDRRETHLAGRARAPGARRPPLRAHVRRRSRRRPGQATGRGPASPTSTVRRTAPATSRTTSTSSIAGRPPGDARPGRPRVPDDELAGQRARRRRGPARPGDGRLRSASTRRRAVRASSRAGSGSGTTRTTTRSSSSSTPPKGPSSSRTSR